MTDTNQIDLQSLRIQAGYQAGHSMDTLIRSYAQNTAGALAVAEAQKVVAEEQIAEHPEAVQAAVDDVGGAVGQRPQPDPAPGHRVQVLHLDAQDVLDNGAAGPGVRRDGWLNRALAHAPGSSGISRGTFVAAPSKIPCKNSRPEMPNFRPKS